MRLSLSIVFSVLFLAESVSIATAQQSPMFSPEEAGALFIEEVKPLLDKKCLGCHGDDPEKMKSGYDVRTRESLLRGGESEVQAIVPGKPGESPLFEAITWQNEDLQMPPKERNRLTPEEQEFFRRWIEAGAPWPEAKQNEAPAPERGGGWAQDGEGDVTFANIGGLNEEWRNRSYAPEDLWAYRPVQRQTVPFSYIKGKDGHNKDGHNAVDAFVLEALEAAGLTPAPEAGKRALLRRAAFDLTGLPPSSDEMDAFLADDSPEAFAKCIDRLLESPHYGEQWGRHWLDVVRYADTGGFSNDFERPNAWRYRDYVVRSFNEDKPYDRFVLEQIAGDELEPDDPEMRVAAGYLRMGPWETTGMSVEAEVRQQFLNDVTNSVGETFLAQGLRCASCHDHKFDPISTEDFYRMQASFATTDFAERPAVFRDSVDTGGFTAGAARMQRLLKEAKDAKAAMTRRSREATLEWMQENGLSDMAYEAAMKLPIDERPPRFLGLSNTDLGVQKILNKRVQTFGISLKRYKPLAFSVNNNYVESTIPKGAGRKRSKTGDKMSETFILTGGSIAAPAQKVAPGVLSAIAGSNDREQPSAWNTIPRTRQGRRLALANWIASANNPLTARVMVNRIWQYHFGRGIAANPNNFGKMGAKPSHPALLDWMAQYFVERDWSVKAMHRLIMNSAAYRRASAHPNLDEIRNQDPDNALLAYFSPRRLTAEELRDAMLLASDELNPALGGLPAYPEINIEVALQPRHIMGSVAPAYQPSPKRAERNRRTIYAVAVRGLANPMLEVFNQPSAALSCERRDASTVTPQAFNLFNSQNSYSRAAAMAQRVADEADTPEARIDLAFRRAFGRAPADGERLQCLEHLEQTTQHHQTHDPVPREFPQEIERQMVEEMTGLKFNWTEELDLYADYEFDLEASDLTPEVRALADLCLVLLNANEFIYIY